MLGGDDATPPGDDGSQPSQYTSMHAGQALKYVEPRGWDQVKCFCYVSRSDKERNDIIKLGVITAVISSHLQIDGTHIKGVHLNCCHTDELGHAIVPIQTPPRSPTLPSSGSSLDPRSPFEPRTPLLDDPRSPLDLRADPNRCPLPNPAFQGLSDFEPRTPLLNDPRSPLDDRMNPFPLEGATVGSTSRPDWGDHESKQKYRALIPLDRFPFVNMELYYVATYFRPAGSDAGRSANDDGTLYCKLLLVPANDRVSVFCGNIGMEPLDQEANPYLRISSRGDGTYEAAVRSFRHHGGPRLYIEVFIEGNISVNDCAWEKM